MEINIRNDSITIDGYVNAVERKSHPLNTRIGTKFVETIKKGAFQRAIERNDDVHLLLNHDWNRDLGNTKDGSLKLYEDNIGLRARATISDKDVIEKARHGDLVGWSFGFTDRDGGVNVGDVDGMITRDVNDMNLYEVSILDRSRTPSYDGTLVSVRNDENIFNGAPFITEIETRDETIVEQKPKEIDYSAAEKMIAEMKGVK